MRGAEASRARAGRRAAGLRGTDGRCPGAIRAGRSELVDLSGRPAFESDCLPTTVDLLGIERAESPATTGPPADGTVPARPIERAPSEQGAPRGAYAAGVKAPRSTLLLELVVWTTYYVLPGGVRRALAGRPLRMEGQTLDPDMQLLLRLERLTTEGGTQSPERRRRHQEVAAGLGGGRPVGGVSVAAMAVPAQHGGLPARLYVPEAVPT